MKFFSFTSLTVALVALIPLGALAAPIPTFQDSSANDIVARGIFKKAAAAAVIGGVAVAAGATFLPAAAIAVGSVGAYHLAKKWLHHRKLKKEEAQAQAQAAPASEADPAPAYSKTPGPEEQTVSPRELDVGALRTEILRRAIEAAEVIVKRQAAYVPQVQDLVRRVEVL